MLYEDEFDDEYDAEDDEYDDTTVTMACDDCDYRWKISLEVDDEEESYDEDLICPMCGSSNVAEI
ncbi:MAG TPA: hypothetical protein PK079_16280 [Leptospiraceae bacterium]|nr:hypothetical protein [Leptospiraceae bacterium]HMX32759.1 hypothetical protein [Leptospiraceae bacterium]HMY33849.1 hypothetical protein [Leptospiraceae bacterium]HMZ66950.1 hypothetical protein [Leptospiraceae bacterium]HNA07776.1 hypothetical protein [Leptospiraceae bacterium]